MALIDQNVLSRLDTGQELSQDDMTRIMAGGSVLKNGGHTGTPQDKTTPGKSPQPSETPSDKKGAIDRAQKSNIAGSVKGVTNVVGGLIPSGVKNLLGVVTQGIDDISNKNPYGLENLGVNTARTIGGVVGLGNLTAAAMEGFLDVTGMRVDDENRDTLEDQGLTNKEARGKLQSIDKALTDAFPSSEESKASPEGVAKDTAEVGLGNKTAAEYGGSPGGEFGGLGSGGEGDTGGGFGDRESEAGGMGGV